MDDSLLGYCGLYCGGCRSYQETVAQGVGKRDEDAACLGCASTVVASWCRDCAIKKCNRERGIRYCLLCQEYPCDELTEFTNDPRYPHHKAVPSDMARLQEIGLAAWLKEQAARWVCLECGAPYHWSARRCPTCNARVNQRLWPDCAPGGSSTA